MSSASGGPGGLASIIVPCFNQLAYTRLCLASLSRHTSSPWELIAIDNGSNDGTAAYLAGYQDAAAFPVSIITEPENRGYPVACNLGLAAARGDYLVLLNNDVVVTDAWLDQLIALANAESGIAMTGPVSNYASPPQLVPETDYRDLEEMRRFAAERRREQRGRWLKVAKLSGFCMLIKRRAFESIGPLDERFSPGFFDDDDWAMRASKAGYESAVALDLFVHHFGSRTFSDSGIDVETLLVENRKRFKDKWGSEVPPMRSAALTPWAGDQESTKADGSISRVDRLRVSLTMIVRDEEDNLPACLESAADLFDEIVVLDTGSTDRTVEIARSFGARVFDFVWVDDFAAARNAALARATGDYAFWLDADDRVEPSQRARLKTLFDGLRATNAAYVVRCACDADPDGGGATVVDHARLFPLREDIRWTYRVHEQILPALRRAGVEIRWTDAVVRHVGYNDPLLRRRKLDRDRAILELERIERPDDPFVLFNLGQIAMETDDVESALGFLERSLAGSTPADSITRKLYALIARARQRLGDLGKALVVCDEGLANDPDDVELLFRKGVIHRLRSESHEAEACWSRIPTLRRPEKFASVDEGLYGHVTWRNLAILAEERGDLVAAHRHWSAVLAARPDNLEAAQAVRRLDPNISR